MKSRHASTVRLWPGCRPAGMQRPAVAEMEIGAAAVPEIGNTGQNWTTRSQANGSAGFICNWRKRVKFGAEGFVEVGKGSRFTL